MYVWLVHIILFFDMETNIYCINYQVPVNVKDWDMRKCDILWLLLYFLFFCQKYKLAIKYRLLKKNKVNHNI